MQPATQIKFRLSIIAAVLVGVAIATIIGQARIISKTQAELATIQQAYYKTLGLNEELEKHLVYTKQVDDTHLQLATQLSRQVGELQLAQRILETSARRCNVTPQYAYQLARMFYSAADMYPVQPALLASVARHESCFNSKAKGAAKEIGLMQILPATAKSLGFTSEELKDPMTNIIAGAMLLSSRPKHEPVEKSLLAYNQGHPRETGNNYGRMVAATYRRML